MPKVRISDVAARAGVAASTVSVVLNNRTGARVSDSTRARVIAAARELDYVPNAAAQRLRMTTQRTLALVSSDLTLYPYGTGLVSGVQAACIERGITMVTVATGDDPRRLREALRLPAAELVDGVVYASTYHHRIDFSGQTMAPPAGTVLLNLEPADLGSFSSVVPDEADAARQVLEAVLNRGHRRVGVATLTSSLEPRERLTSLRTVWQEHGLHPNDLLLDQSPDHDATAEGGFAATDRLLRHSPRPTAIVCFNDRMAMGAYEAARHHGLVVPRDLSVVGHDDLEPVAESLFPPLTTFAPPHQEMAERAVTLLIEPPQEPSTERLVGTLRQRASLAPPG